MKYTRHIILSTVFLCVSASAIADHVVTYVGLGRYSCSGSTAECAQINFNNQQVELSNRLRYEEKQAHAQQIVEESGRRERE